MFVLFLFLFLGFPTGYFWIEVTLLNLLFFYVRARHAAAFRILLAEAPRPGSH